MLRHLPTFRALNENAAHAFSLPCLWRDASVDALYETDLKTPENIGRILTESSSPGTLRLIKFVIGAMCAEVSDYHVSPVIRRIMTTGYEWGYFGENHSQAELAALLPEVESAHLLTPLAYYMGHMQRVIVVASCLCEAARALEDGDEQKFKLNFSAMFRWYVQSVAEKRHYDECLRRGQLVQCVDGSIASNGNYRESASTKPVPYVDDYATQVKEELRDFLLILLSTAGAGAQKAA